MNAIERLRELGQSTWLDYLDHDLLESHELDRMIEQEGIAGMTSNPTIFQKAIEKSSAYDDLLRSASRSESDQQLLERIMVGEIREACDRFRDLYESTNGGDGFVSIEVSPGAANDARRTMEEARRLWKTVGRPNLFVKIPGTEEGVSAIRQCLFDGININITLLFSVDRYVQVAHAYLDALEARLAKGRSIERVASVASFFVSRIDKIVDAKLDAAPNSLAGAAQGLRGQVAIANAKIAYEEYEKLVRSERFQRLAQHGALPQRLLWASTSPKDPRYSDTYYVDALVGKDTIDTMPPATLKAYLDHGKPEERLTHERRFAHMQLDALAPLAIDFAEVTHDLEVDGVDQFAESYDETVKTIGGKRRKLAA